MIQKADGEVVISNDGATILKLMSVTHPCAKMLVELSEAQDVEAGDGTTSVVVLAGAMLGAAEKLLSKDIHPGRISESFLLCRAKAAEVLREMSIPVDLNDRESLEKAAITSLNSKIVSQHSDKIAPIAVEAVLRVIDMSPDSKVTNVDLKDIKIVKKVGGTIDDMELINGVVLNQEVSKSASGPSRMEDARIAIVQFQLSPPKPDMDNQIVVNDYRQMDRILKEERQYLLDICKKIKKTNCNVLLVQKSILRDAVSELALHFLSKLKIMVISDIERDEIDFLARSIGCKPIADISAFHEDKLGYAALVEEVSLDNTSYTCISGIKHQHKTVSVLCRGANAAILDEVERSFHDAICVIRSLVKERAFIAGGGAPEFEVSWRLSDYAKTLSGVDAICMAAFAESLEVIPSTLAENAGFDPITLITEMRSKHALGERNAGINVRKGTVSDMIEENVLQPLLVSLSAMHLAAETVAMILKIDGIVMTR